MTASNACITYQLMITVEKAVRIEVGRLGDFTFPAGAYIYTGSAKKNIDARIARHLRSEKALRWHIDYLLADTAVTVVNVIRSREPECRLNQSVHGQIIAPRFGASDCRAGCGSHLKLLTKK